MFLFSLARELGKTVKQLLLELDSVEIAEWRAFFRIENEKYDKPKAIPGDPGKQVYGVDKQGAAMLKAAFAHKVRKAE